MNVDVGVGSEKECLSLYDNAMKYLIRGMQGWIDENENDQNDRNQGRPSEGMSNRMTASASKGPSDRQ
jgi:hypothetical protein